MNKITFIQGIFLLLSCVEAKAQDSLLVKSKWEGSANLNFNFLQDDFFVLPIFRADKGWLHLEGRYNYESQNTFSVWGGYNISGGDKFEYFFTPMVGFVAGDITGVAPGLEISLGFHGFEFYSETEYFIAPDNKEENYLYTWDVLTWSPVEWFWFGISGQRSRLYENDLDIQRGVTVGGGYKNWELSGYVYNPGNDDIFLVASVTY